ncbi:hypothetical protein [Methanoregula sp.]|uniref:hypothetical protein n=1 Tax=Methanoregula sp. TaxID=2052170 RepID=UPI0025D2D1D1|nr:hypothetical protein [Methanoregula sp.]
MMRCTILMATGCTRAHLAEITLVFIGAAILFLPLADGFGAYNRYYGRQPDGSIKVRDVDSFSDIL